LTCHAKNTGVFCEEGEGGFGYGRVFFVPQKNCTAAQLSAADKNQLSHHACAFGALKNPWTTLSERTGGKLLY